MGPHKGPLGPWAHGLMVPWAHGPIGPWAHGPWPRPGPGPNGPWTQKMGPGPKRALGQMGPGPTWALGPTFTSMKTPLDPAAGYDGYFKGHRDVSVSPPKMI